MFPPYTPISRPISVGDVYSRPIQVPTGFEAVAFRPAISGEQFMPALGGLVRYWDATAPLGPRIIVRPLPKRKVITFTQAPKKALVQKGEYYSIKILGNQILLAFSDFANDSDITVYTREETEI